MLGLANAYVAIAAAILAIGYAAVKIVSDVNHANSIEGRLEEARDCAEAAKSAAQEANEAYNTLLTKGDQYNETQKRLQELTKGTQEYTQALIDNNNVVLGMVDAYPGLRKYLKMEDGVLSFDEIGYAQYSKDLEGGVEKT
jgi:hypothetical protein